MLPPSGFATLRDALSFVLGTGILVYSIMFEPPPPEALSVGAGVALVGIPPVAAFANRSRNGGADNAP